jgi:hypothetical protein
MEPTTVRGGQAQVLDSVFFLGGARISATALSLHPAFKRCHVHIYGLMVFNCSECIQLNAVKHRTWPRKSHGKPLIPGRQMIFRLPPVL